MKKPISKILLSMGLIASMSTQVFAMATLDENAVDKNITAGLAVTTSIAIEPTLSAEPILISEPVTTTALPDVNIKKVEPKNFIGLMPNEMIELTYTDSNNNDTLVKTILTFDKNDYYSDTKIARPTPYLTIGNTVYIELNADNPYEENSTDFTSFESLSNNKFTVVENEITDMDRINEVFKAMFGSELNVETLNNYKYIQNPVTNRMTILEFEIYAPVNEEATEYDVLAKVTYTIGDNVSVIVPIVQDKAVDPAFYYIQKLFLNYEEVAQKSIIKDGYIYLPVRTFGDYTNNTVTYNPSSKSVTFKKGKTEFITAYGATTSTKFVDGTNVGSFAISNPLFIKDGVGYIPADFYLDALAFDTK